MKTKIKSTFLFAALVAVAATTATASSGTLVPVDRFDGPAAFKAAFESNVKSLHVRVRPGNMLTAKDREFAVDVMNSNASFAIKANIINALYADDGEAITSNGLY